ncbi:hypothetical protein TRFO_21709 [Tritrichomonas foetus]|uniref:Alpha-actinin n=1 Tax=Tritrichomonas foetus TaxID=1144522 RepID=A0A1J4KDW2_9EUKA|nr:hypothetical protein [Tritrichomonas foetus]OHT09387.1 hypothetical protein TRFO_21709 [Tritrichomonas foetus]|eukprot:OHT09387.1 hypothetical protein TRFO_21709 [Tritrichomonas foetus]
MALQFVTEEKKIKLIGIHPDDIVDGNLKLTLGLIWSCINKFQIEDISVEEQTARNALLQWCKKNTQGYDGVNITNFTSSWNTGLAFCALINRFRPEVLDYNSLDKGNSLENCTKAFDACRQLGLFVYLDPEDIADIQPDEKSVVTQVSEFFHFFAGESKVEAMADMLRRTISIQREIDELKSNYAEQARAALSAMGDANNEITDSNYERTVPGIKSKLIDVIKYARVARPNIVELRGTALKTWGQLVTRCKATSRPLPVPPQGLEPETLTSSLNALDDNAATRRNSLSDELKEAQNRLIEEFDTNCHNISLHCDNVNNQCLALSGPLEGQKDQLDQLQATVTQIRGFVDQLQAPYDYLVSLKLNYKAKNSITSISSQVDKVEALIKHLAFNLSAQIEEEQQMARVAAYNQMADAKVQETKDLDQKIESVNGDNEAKRVALLDLDNEVSRRQADVSSLVAPYEELEREELQLHAPYTPDSINTLFFALSSQIHSLISGIDASIAASKGFEISEEQLSEYRETFRMFDKDKNNTLVNYELNACLTALGETSSEAECTQIIAKYTNGGKVMDFDTYVKFMLDRFSKAENKDTTTEAFRAIAQNSPVVSEEQLRKFFSPEDVEYLKTQLTPVDGGYDFASWVDTLYA